nr:hypothetical protein [Tanacetum cinerariifolium]
MIGILQPNEVSHLVLSLSDPEIVALKAKMAEINKSLMKVLQINQQVKAVTHNCETCGGPHSYNDCPATVGQTQNVYVARAYTQGGNSYQPQVERETGVIKDTVPPTNNRSTKDVQPLVVQIETLIPNSKPVVAPVVEPVVAPWQPTPYNDPIVSTSSLTLTPFGVSDFLPEEVNAFLALKDDPTSPEVDHSYYDMEGDIVLFEAFLNDDPSLPPPTQGMYFPQIRKELKICEAKIDKSLIDEPLEVELKDLPPHLDYAFLEGDDKLPVIIAKDLSVK